MICGQLPLCALDVSQWASCSSVVVVDVSQRASVTVPTRGTTLDWVINCVKHMMNNNVQRTPWKPEATIAVTEVLYMWRRTLYSSAFVTECQPEWMQVGGSPDIDPWFCPDFWPHQWLEPPRGCHNRCCCHKLSPNCTRKCSSIQKPCHQFEIFFPFHDDQKNFLIWNLKAWTSILLKYKANTNGKAIQWWTPPWISQRDPRVVHSRLIWPLSRNQNAENLSQIGLHQDWKAKVSSPDQALSFWHL